MPSFSSVEAIPMVRVKKVLLYAMPSCSGLWIDSCTDSEMRGSTGSRTISERSDDLGLGHTTLALESEGKR
jgi:hypothetical protein